MTPASKKKTTARRPVPGRRTFGWRPDLPDQRDFLYEALRSQPAQLPQHVDLRAFCSPVEDQASLGSCTANALAGALECLDLRDKKPGVDLSRLFIYYNQRTLTKTVEMDAGATLRDGLKTLASYGVCGEKAWPFSAAHVAKKPGAPCYKEALRHRIASYHRILTLGEMLSCLAEGFPFVFGFTVYESFGSGQVAETGALAMPRPRERALGGHAALAVGYNQDQQRFIVRNCWGTSWGNKGYFTMPYAYLADRNLSDDFWTIRRG